MLASFDVIAENRVIVSADPQSTRSTLLARVRDLGDQDAWKQFVELYEPVIQRYLKRQRLQDADSADVAQDTLRKIASAIGRLEYDRGKGRFRGWLLTITHRSLLDHFKRAKKTVAGSGDTHVHAMLEAQTSDADAQEWDRDCEHQIVQWAMREVESKFQPNTWQAFRGTAVENRSAEAVAAELGISVGAVYIAKTRVTARLRRVVAELEDDG